MTGKLLTALGVAGVAHQPAAIVETYVATAPARAPATELRQTILQSVKP